MGFYASVDDVKNDPDLTTSGTYGDGVQVVPSVPIDLTPNLPELPPELIATPSVTITVESDMVHPDPAGPDAMPEPVSVEPQES